MDTASPPAPPRLPRSLLSAAAKDAAAVQSAVEQTFSRLYHDASCHWLTRVFEDVQTLFHGEHPDYCAGDLQYHNFEHTLQVTMCVVSLMEGRALAGVAPRLDPRHFELTAAAALLHDTGYLKLRSDRSGTGAKYTYCHVLRSCAFAASYLAAVGIDERELQAVLAAINSTGPEVEIGRLAFRDPVDRLIACMVVTADYLGQMSAPDYPEKLPLLFEEFRESDIYATIPRSRRLYNSAEQLIAQTPMFWERQVRPRLDSEYGAVYRFLARPYPDGPNAYLDLIEQNIARIRIL